MSESEGQPLPEEEAKNDFPEVIIKRSGGDLPDNSTKEQFKSLAPPTKEQLSEDDSSHLTSPELAQALASLEELKKDPLSGEISGGSTEDKSPRPWHGDFYLQ